MDKIVHILIAASERLEVINLKRTLSKMHILYKLHEAKDVNEAIDILESIGQSPGQKLPDFVLIDINLVRESGLSLLHLIRGNLHWKDLKCYMIVDTQEDVDRIKQDGLYVSGYLQKPLKLTNVLSTDTFNLMIDILNEKVT